MTATSRWTSWRSSSGCGADVAWLVLVVIVGGWAWAGWANAPAPVHANPGVFVLAIIAGCLVCWWVGRRQGRAAAYAVATAHAEARAAAAARASSASTAQAAVVVNVGTGARATAARELGGLDRADWMGEPRPLLEQDSSEVAAADVLAEGVAEPSAAQVV